MASRERAEHLLVEERFAEAVEQFRALLAEAPAQPELRGRVAEAYKLSGNLERALHHYLQAAKLHSAAGHLAQACLMLKGANEVSPGEPNILYRMAESLKELGQQKEFEEVLPQLVRAANLPGDRRRLWALDELYALNPHDIGVAEHRALALTRTNRSTDAIKAWQALMYIYSQQGIDPEPILSKAAETAADSPELSIVLADMMLAQQKAREALSLLVPHYEKHPEHIEVLECLLRILEQLGATDKIVPARMELIKARVKNRQKTPALVQIGRLLAEAPDYTPALEVCAHACAAFELKEEATKLWRRLCLIYQSVGNYAERDRAIHRLLKINPDDIQALRLGAQVLAEAGRTQEAKALQRRLEKVLKTQQQQLENHISEGQRSPTPPPARVGRGLTIPGRGPSRPKTQVIDELDVVEVATLDPVSELPNFGTASEVDTAGTLPEQDSFDQYLATEVFAEDEVTSRTAILHPLVEDSEDLITQGVATDDLPGFRDTDDLGGDDFEKEYPSQANFDLVRSLKKV